MEVYWWEDSLSSSFHIWLRGVANQQYLHNSGLFEHHMGLLDEEDGSVESLDGERAILRSSMDSTIFQLDELDQDSESGGSDTQVCPTPPLNQGFDKVGEAEPITVLERLIRTHPVWYLPNIGRTGSVSLLQHQQLGAFLVRQSSKKDTMALSVRQNGDPAIEHYLIECSVEGLRLEGSFHNFSAMPLLIAYYVENLDELPVRLLLPPAIANARSLQELTSLALLGQDFWTSALMQTNKSFGNKTMPLYPTSHITDNGRPASGSSDAASLSSEDNTGRDSPFQMLNELDLLVNENIQEFEKNKQNIIASSKKSSKFSHSTENQTNILINGFSKTSITTSNTEVVSEATENQIHQSKLTTHQVNISAKSNIISSSVLTDSHSDKSEFTSKVSSAKVKDSDSLCNGHHTPINISEPESKGGNTPISIPVPKEDDNTAPISISETESNNKNTPVNIPVSDSRSKQTPINIPVSAYNKKKTCTPNTPYFEGCLADRLSDYEDIWNTPLATPSSFDNKKQHFLFVQNPNFDVQSNSNSHDTSIVNPGYQSDEESVSSRDPSMYDSEDSKDPQLLQRTDVKRDDEIADATISPENTGTIIRQHKLKDNTHVFSFDFFLPPSPPDFGPDGLLSNTRPVSPPLATSTANRTTFTVTTPPLGGSMFSSPSSTQPVKSQDDKVEISETRMNSTSSDKQMLLCDSPASPNRTTPPPIPARRYKTSPQEDPDSFKDIFKQRMMETAILDTIASPEPIVSSKPSSLQQRPPPSPTPHNERRKKSSRKHSSGAGKSQSFRAALPNVTHLRQGDNKFNSLPPPKDRLRKSSEKSSKNGSALSRLNVRMNGDSCHSYQSKQSPRSTPERCIINENKFNLIEKGHGGVTRPDVISDDTRHLISDEQKLSDSFEDDYFSISEEPLLEENDRPKSQSPKPTKFPMNGGTSRPTSFSDMSTVEDMISDLSPDLTVKPIKPLTLRNVQRMSDYDNMGGTFRPASSAGTEFCKPWDSSIWKNLLGMGDGPSQSLVNSSQSSPPPPPVTTPLSPEFSKTLQQWKENNKDINLEDGDSEADYSSIYVESHQGEPKTIHHTLDLGCDIAASFEWHRPDLMFGTSPPKDTPIVRPISVPVKVPSPPPRDLSSQTTGKPIPINPSVNRAKQTCDSSMDRFRGLSPPSYDRDDLFSDEEHDSMVDNENLITESFKDRLMPFLGSSRLLSLKSNKVNNPVVKVRDFVTRLSVNTMTTFGITIQNFIQCTKDGAECNPHVVMRNVRQFMHGIKNYLVKHGEEELNMLIEQERSKLESDEFLNIDAIIENALHRCVIKPLKQHIYKLFVDEYSRNGNIKRLSENIKYARTKTPEDMGIKPELLPPQGTSLEVIKHFLTKMQKAYSPLKKLENLLGAISSIYNSVEGMTTTTKSKRGDVVSIGADDFLPIVIYVLVHSGLVAAEIEADYMWGLLHPSLLAGEGGYYLTTLSSAVHVLKNFKETFEAQPITAQTCLPSIGDLNGFMKILIPDEQCDSIISKTLPVRPNMPTRDVCSMIAHKFKITNPQDYGLYQVMDGIETKLSDKQCPQNIRAELMSDGRQCFFTFKRNNAKFVWPVSLKL